MRNWLAETKTVTAIQPVLNATAATVVIIDTKGYSIAKVFLAVGVTADDFTVMKIEQSEVANFGSGVSDLKVVDLTDAATNDPDNSIFGVDLDLRNAARYLRMGVTKGTGNATYGAFMILGNAHASPIDDAGRGYNFGFGDPA